jgi:hypothetical protein
VQWGVVVGSLLKELMKRRLMTFMGLTVLVFICIKAGAIDIG